MELWESIVKANKEITTIKLKGKDYCEVKERVIAFRKVYPRGRIVTDVQFTDNYIMAKANIYANFPMSEFEDLIATGYSRELANKPFALENAETSAIGRALGFCGFGISTSIASADEMQTYEDSKVFDEDTALLQKRKEQAIDKFYELSVKQQADILNVMHKQQPDDINVDTLEELVRNAK